MTLASLRSRRVAVYAYSAPIDATSGIAASTYTRTLSSDTDGLWWAARGTRTGTETSPTGAAQHQTYAVFEFDSEVPVTADGVIVDGAEVHRITAVLPRDYGRDEIQVLAVRVDDADAAFTLQEPTP